MKQSNLVEEMRKILYKEFIRDLLSGSFGSNAIFDVLGDQEKLDSCFKDWLMISAEEVKREFEEREEYTESDLKNACWVTYTRNSPRQSVRDIKKLYSEFEKWYEENRDLFAS